MSEWQPIETADTAEMGPEILLYANGSIYLGRVWWHEEGKPVWFNGDYRIDEPTHWMPLPDPPALAKAAE